MDSVKNAAHWAAQPIRVIKAFFDVRDGDGLLKNGRKVAEILLSRIVYAMADYWLMIASGIFIVTMDRQYGFGPIALFILMWGFDLVVAGAFVIIWRLTGKDITLGESYRRAVDEIALKSPSAGHLATLGVVVKATFWDGPEHIAIYFRKEIRTSTRMVVVLILLTALQAAVWTPVYVLGYDSARELVVALGRIVT